VTGQGVVERTGDALIVLALAAAGWRLARWFWPIIPKGTT
jgi:hypothetical protein